MRLIRLINHAKKNVALASVLTMFTALCARSDASVDAFPSSPEVKIALASLGFDSEWKTTQGGEKLALESGDLWLREGNYFAVLNVNDVDEQTMHSSLVHNLTVCTRLGIATTGSSSSKMFKTYGELVKQALIQPEVTVQTGGTRFQYHVLVTELIKDTPLIQCGVKRL